jgi:hypothetical protein
VPPFLPDAPAVRSDLLDYCVEIEWFDRHLGQMLKALEDAGELDNTLVIVTADNGMPFPRAKANCYESGIHVPLAVRWPTAGGKTGRRVTDPVGFVDLTATILDVAGAKPAGRIEGKILRAVLASDKDGAADPARDAVYASRERHSSARYDNLGYPQRCVRRHLRAGRRADGREQPLPERSSFASSTPLDWGDDLRLRPDSLTTALPRIPPGVPHHSRCSGCPFWAVLCHSAGRSSAGQLFVLPLPDGLCPETLPRSSRESQSADREVPALSGLASRPAFRGAERLPPARRFSADIRKR